MKTAEVINQGSVQSVVLPGDIRLKGREVFVKQVGRSVLLIPKDSDLWQLLLKSLDEFTTDYMESRSQPPQQAREVAFK